MNRNTMGGDNRSVLDHAYCFLAMPAWMCGSGWARPQEIVIADSSMPGASCENRETMGEDNRSVLGHACCLPSGNAIVDVWFPTGLGRL
jgi:hypothetical protein